MNSPFVQERAAALARRVRDEASDDQRAAIHFVFRLCFGRKPEADEEASALKFLSTGAGTGNESGRTDKTTDKATDTMTRFCQAILCTVEFRNLD